MSVYDLYFAFGKPGTYFLDHTQGNYSQRMPTQYYEYTRKYPAKSFKTLACDANDNLFMVWVRESGTLVGKAKLQHDYPSLHRFLGKEGSIYCQVHFGSEVGEYFVMSEKTGNRQWISDRLDKDFEYETQRFKLCSLGINGTYVAIFTDGGARWSLDEEYPDLLKILKRIRQGDLVFAALNPYRANEFFVALADGIVHIRASALVESHVLGILEQYPNLTVVTSDIVKHSQHSSQGFPPKSRRKEFVKFIAKNVAGGVISSAVAATFSCTVM